MRPLELEAGTLIAQKYRLVRPAGFGGMAQIWVAKNEATAAEVCVKVLLYSRSADDDAIDRFRREAHAAAKLSHRGIVRVFDLIELDAGLVIVMELLRGESLFDKLAREGKLSEDAVLEIAFPVLTSLAYAHAAGVVHRDLKPDNVFLAQEPDGEIVPKILDFGVSKLLTPDVPRITTDGASLGTPGYMSPEQARGSADTDARSDVFAMGILLYEMLTGKNPFASESYHSVVAAILERMPPTPPAVPSPIARVVMRALEKKREDRWPDARAFADALRSSRVAKAEPALSQVSVPPAAPLLSETPQPPAPSRSRAFFLAASIGGAVALLVTGVALHTVHSGDAGTTRAIDSRSVTTGAGPTMSVSTITPVTSAVGVASITPTPSAGPSAAISSPHARPSASSHASAPSGKPSGAPSHDSAIGVVRDPGF